MKQLTFTAYATPQPQGSAKAFVIRGRAIVTSDNTKLKPYRGEVTREAMLAMNRADCSMPMAGKHIPVGLILDFFLARPPSVPKKRKEMVVKPDIDKLVRATIDALTGILYFDDAQVVEVVARKHYGVPERVEVHLQILE